MGYNTAIFANPYLIALWKTLWMIANHDNVTAEITQEECIRISEESGLGADYLRKNVMAASYTLSRFKIATLNSLCMALHKHLETFPQTWEEYQISQERRPIYIKCQVLSNSLAIHEAQKVEGKKDKLTVNRPLSHVIVKLALRNARAMLRKGEEDADSNVHGMAKEELNWAVDVATEEDVTKIYEFAIGRYEDCPINGPEIKLPWWYQNPNIFFVMHSEDDKVCANINLLPLKPDCYNQMKAGIIDERGIRAEDLYKPDEKHLVEHIYVEGFNSPKRSYTGSLLALFPVMLNRLANIDNPDLVIGAIGGTDDGENLMETLGFEVVTFAKDRIDELNFFEVKYSDAIKRSQRQRVNILTKK